MDFRELAIANIDAITCRDFPNKISNRVFIAALDHIENLYDRSEKSLGILPDKTQIRLPAPYDPLGTRVYKIFSEINLKIGNIFFAKGAKPRIYKIITHNKPPFRSSP